MGAPWTHENNLKRWNTSYSFNLYSQNVTRARYDKFKDLQLHSNKGPNKVGRARKAPYSRYVHQQNSFINFPRDSQRVRQHTECFCHTNQPKFQRNSRNRFKSFSYQRRNRANRFYGDGVSRKYSSQKTTKKVQISAPANTTQFLIDDFESRYKSVDFSHADLSEKENLLGCQNLSAQPVKDLEKNGFEQSLVKDKILYAFDECFGQMEFEDLYADIQQSRVD